MFPDAYIFRADDVSHRIYSTKSICLSCHSSCSHLVQHSWPEQKRWCVRLRLLRRKKSCRSRFGLLVLAVRLAPCPVSFARHLRQRIIRAWCCRERAAYALRIRGFALQALGVGASRFASAAQCRRFQSDGRVLYAEGRRVGVRLCTDAPDCDPAAVALSTVYCGCRTLCWPHGRRAPRDPVRSMCRSEVHVTRPCASRLIPTCLHRQGLIILSRCGRGLLWSAAFVVLAANLGVDPLVALSGFGAGCVVSLRPVRHHTRARTKTDTGSALSPCSVGSDLRTRM